jgi:hypothetical protein
MTTNIGSVKLMLEEFYKGRALWSYASGKRIPLFEDEVCIIYRGIVRTQTLQPGGEESILGFIGPMMPVARKFTLLNPYEVHALTFYALVGMKSSGLMIWCES